MRFIYCIDEKTKEKLIKNGCKFISESSIDNKLIYIFEDNKSMIFENQDKILRTNKLYF